MVSFHLNDDCDLRCEDCHWFSSPIVSCIAPDAKAYVQWIKRHKPPIIRLSGGEPTLYHDINNLLLSIPKQIRIDLFTNGNHIHKLSDEISKKNINLKISMNRKVPNVFKPNLQVSDWSTTFFSFHHVLDCYQLTNQITGGKALSNLLGKTIHCLPYLSRFGTDGYEYYCEVGLRNKHPELRTGNSLWTVYKKVTPKICTVKEECLSCFIGEQKIVNILKN